MQIIQKLIQFKKYITIINPIIPKKRRTPKNSQDLENFCKLESAIHH